MGFFYESSRGVFFSLLLFFLVCGSSFHGLWPLPAQIALLCIWDASTDCRDVRAADVACMGIDALAMNVFAEFQCVILKTTWLLIIRVCGLTYYTHRPTLWGECAVALPIYPVLHTVWWGCCGTQCPTLWGEGAVALTVLYPVNHTVGCGCCSFTYTIPSAPHCGVRVVSHIRINKYKYLMFVLNTFSCSIIHFGTYLFFPYSIFFSCLLFIFFLSRASL